MEIGTKMKIKETALAESQTWTDRIGYGCDSGAESRKRDEGIRNRARRYHTEQSTGHGDGTEPNAPE